ncbi:MAG TPA: metallophosphoesterase [Azospirillaceae bacterium]|nr:metallophosphoesterase [Azospirillaceae bacterium]
MSADPHFARPMPRLVSRRTATRLLAGSAAPLLFAPARLGAAQSGPDLIVVILSDLHSGYDRAAPTLAALDGMLALYRGVPALIVINGDVFERGNTVALRTEGLVDWAFLAALRRRAPVVLNIGNHEGALADDLVHVVASADAADLLVVSNIVDRRVGLPFASARVRLALGGRTVHVVGLATDDASAYREPVRGTLDLPAPVAWAEANLAGALAGAQFGIVLSHAGVAADRRILDRVPDGTLVVGGHDHLSLVHGHGRTRYLHTGSWNRQLTVAGIGFQGGRPEIALLQVPVDAAAPGDKEMAALVRETMARHLTQSEREVLGRLPAAMDLSAAARFLARSVAAAAGGQVGLINHTNLGTGLPAGQVNRHAFDAFVRFDGSLFKAEVDGDTLRRILARANQDADTPLDLRTGDFVYANEVPAAPAPEARYGIVTTGWVRQNAGRYLGRDDIAFTEVPNARLKAVAAQALPR